MKQELCVKLVIYKNWTETHGQRNMGKKIVMYFYAEFHENMAHDLV
jgi:hypothetical protein